MHDFNSGLVLFNKDATGLYHQPKTFQILDFEMYILPLI